MENLLIFFLLLQLHQLYLWLIHTKTHTHTLIHAYATCLRNQKERVDLAVGCDKRRRKTKSSELWVRETKQNQVTIVFSFPGIPLYIA